MRTDGRPSRVAVASAISVASGSSSRTCANQRSNCRNGFGVGVGFAQRLAEIFASDVGETHAALVVGSLVVGGSPRTTEPTHYVTESRRSRPPRARRRLRPAIRTAAARTAAS